MEPLASAVTTTKFDALRRGNFERLDRVAASLLRSPIRHPDMAVDRGRQRVRVCSPAPLADVGARMGGTLVDASADVCRWIQHKCADGDAVAVRGSLYGLPLPSHSVDEFVVPAYTLQTLASPLQILREIRRVLKPDVGRLRTWWLLWPTATIGLSPDRVVSVAGLCSTYRLADDALTIERDDEPGRPATTQRERWRIRAARRDEASSMLSEAGLMQAARFGVTRCDFGGLTVDGVECRA